MNQKMIKKIAIAMIAYGCIACILSFFYLEPGWTLSIFIGCITMLLNMAALSFLWKLIFFKKSIALATIIIIFKYAILAMILWSLTSIEGVRPLGFVIGMGSLLFAVLIMPLINFILVRKS